MRKGQVTILGMMLFSLAIIIAIAMIPFLKENLTDVRGDEQLNCTNDEITIGVSMTCLFVDLILPYFIGAVVIAAGGLLAFRT